VAEQQNLMLARAEQDAELVRWQEMLQRIVEAVRDVGGRKVVADALGMSEGRLSNLLAERGDHRLRFQDVDVMARDDRSLAEYIAESWGLTVVRGPREADDLERLEQRVIDEHGPSGARTVMQDREARRARERAAKRRK
jgi:hypothetical protein